jgi:heme/copper-type cytochrome/quinol oxidase subunit 2
MSDKFLKDQNLQINEAFRQLKQQQEESDLFYWFLCFLIFIVTGVFFFFVWVGKYARKSKEMEAERKKDLEKKVK